MKVKVKLCKLTMNTDEVKIISQDILENCIFTKNNFGFPFYHMKKIRNKKIKPLYFITPTENSNSGKHITMNLIQEQKFLFMYHKHWIQKKSNLLWLIGLSIATITTILLSIL